MRAEAIPEEVRGVRWGEWVGVIPEEVLEVCVGEWTGVIPEEMLEVDSVDSRVRTLLCERVLRSRESHLRTRATFGRHHQNRAAICSRIVYKVPLRHLGSRDIHCCLKDIFPCNIFGHSLAPLLYLQSNPVGRLEGARVAPLVWVEATRAPVEIRVVELVVARAAVVAKLEEGVVVKLVVATAEV